jgi:hypothetical protein
VGGVVTLSIQQKHEERAGTSILEGLELRGKLNPGKKRYSDGAETWTLQAVWKPNSGALGIPIPADSLISNSSDLHIVSSLFSASQPALRSKLESTLPEFRNTSSECHPASFRLRSDKVQGRASH